MSIKVLLVEDNAIAQKFSVFILSAYQCEVDLARDGAEALSLLMQKKYDMIFVDYGLPDITGSVLTKKIREIKAFEKLPVIGLSAHDAKVNGVDYQHDYEQECLQAGMDVYMTKPLREEQVVELLKTYVPDKV